MIKNKRICSAVAAFVVAAALFAGCGGGPQAETMMATVPVTQPPTVSTEPSLPATEPPEPQPERFVLTFVGDCTLGANPNHYNIGLGFIHTIGEDYGHPFRNVIDYFENDEMTFINLEGALCDSGNPMVKRFVFRGPTSYINILTENSVEFASLANNHTMDYGQKGYHSTIDTLNAAGIPFVERDSSTIITTPNGLTIGIYGAVYYYLDVEDMTQEITQLRQQGADLVIFAPHWGSEGSYRPTPEQQKVAKAAVEAGADLIWGSHPHVLQPMERMGESIVFYSLGNFSFGGNIYPQDYDSALIQLEVIREPDGTVRLGEPTIVPVNVSSVAGKNNYQPTPYEPGSKEYERVLEKLAGTFTGPNLVVG